MDVADDDDVSWLMPLFCSQHNRNLASRELKDPWPTLRISARFCLTSRCPFRRRSSSQQSPSSVIKSKSNVLHLAIYPRRSRTSHEVLRCLPRRPVRHFQRHRLHPGVEGIRRAGEFVYHLSSSPGEWHRPQLGRVLMMLVVSACCPAAGVRIRPCPLVHIGDQQLRPAATSARAYRAAVIWHPLCSASAALSLGWHLFRYRTTMLPCNLRLTDSILFAHCL